MKGRRALRARGRVVVVLGLLQRGGYPDRVFLYSKEVGGARALARRRFRDPEAEIKVLWLPSASLGLSTQGFDILLI